MIFDVNFFSLPINAFVGMISSLTGGCMTAVLSFIGFSLLWILPALPAVSLTRSVLAFLCPWGAHSRAAVYGLAPAVGISFFLVFFSLAGRVVPSHPAAALLAFFGMTLLQLFFRRRLPPDREHLAFPLILIFVLFLCVHISFWLPRISFSDLHFDPSQYGAEKLFNLSLQQSFTYGAGYPPESVWLAGERETYYILPRVLPGLATYLSVHYFDAPAQIAGLFFHLSDAFYNTLAVMTLGCIAYLLLQRARIKKISAVLLSASIGIFPFLAAPVRIFAQLFEGHIDFWSLSRIIPFTINEYPFWNYAFADNHAHNNAAFLDVFVWFLTLMLLSRGNGFNRGQKIQFGLLLGVCATALLMAQTGSAFIAVVVFALPLVLMFFESVRSGQGRAFTELLAWPAGFAFLLSLPDVLSRPQPRVLWNWVPPRLASSINDYSNVYFSIFVFLGLCLVFLNYPRGLFSRLSSLRFSIPAVVAALIAAAILGYPALLVAGFFCLLACAPAAGFGDADFRFSKRVMAALFVLIGFPEIVGINFDMGPDYIRFNTAFKFLYTAFFTIPLSLVFVYSLQPQPELKKWPKRAAGTCVCVFALVMAAVQIATLNKRIAASRPAGGLNGMEFLAKQRPADALLIEKLNLLRGRVVIVEACGMPPREASYTLAGRISAYSGRPSLCGWGMHSFLHREFMRSGVNKGRHVWSYLSETDEKILRVFSGGGKATNNLSQDIAPEIQVLKERGATHLVFGEHEHSLFPKTTVHTLAASTGGTIVFQIGEYGIIELR
jgi:uncharacterized membrane protein